jgi:hypothetical protein
MGKVFCKSLRTLIAREQGGVGCEKRPNRTDNGKTLVIINEY